MATKLSDGGAGRREKFGRGMMLRGFPIDGYGAMSGGAPGGRGIGALRGRAPRAIYIGYGAYDAETKPGALALAAVFESARWPVRVAEHPFGHGAREVYLDEAFAFWAAQ